MRVKLFKKRLRITKNGKILRRSCNLGHTQAKDSSRVKRARKRQISMSKKHIKSIIQNSN